MHVEPADQDIHSRTHTHALYLNFVCAGRCPSRRRLDFFGKHSWRPYVFAEARRDPEEVINSITPPHSILALIHQFSAHPSQLLCCAVCLTQICCAQRWVRETDTLSQGSRDFASEWQRWSRGSGFSAQGVQTTLSQTLGAECQALVTATGCSIKL